VIELLRRSFVAAIIAVGFPMVAAAGASTTVVPQAAARASVPMAAGAALGAPKEPAAAHCRGDPNPDSPATVGPSMWDDETLSGGRHNDVIISTHSNPICAYQGNDLIRAWQSGPGIANEISGGPPRKDRAIVDQKDLANMTNVELCKLSPSAPKWRPCNAYISRARRLAKATAKKDLNYTHYESALECRSEPGTGRRQIIFLREPWLPAVDATAQPDWETVAYAANLNKWDGSKWVFVSQNSWLWDRTSDSVQATPGSATRNFWRRFDNNQRWFVWFYPDSPGMYRISITYHWYATPNVPEHEETVWAGKHYGDFEGPGHQWCNFPS
jgi:hypothetical protein